eukprot:CAMPEP_0183307460 /NCGR_PEP_ID=MMETSP0160_2-20130417/17375_1 /TAXON_ID=2839 ORGANISM="Odontella Sinensis, Strain Grunow 1884" /NCGR_SAMPLE_ID=MMETSP0160_2 /ASSEMBLY_ACC=CAM_ASM_000250 /LENGTH=271 /DNA_ID=CAMNT_0025471049 /DNA_START=54 /DNA_END=869 /DNA_ORIENTATION=+
MKLINAAVALGFFFLNYAFANASDETTDRALKKMAPPLPRANTMWWVLFNKPSMCTTNPSGPIFCGMPDVMAAGSNGNSAEIAIISASGGVSDKKGKLLMVSTIYKSCGTLDLQVDEDLYAWGGPANFQRGYCPSPGEATEVHIVIRDHGPVVEADKIAQISTFTDASCSQRSGPNLCVDSGVAAFPPSMSSGIETTDAGCFPMFCPETCTECTEEQKSVQLIAGMGNEVTLKHVGDTMTAIAEITIPGKGKKGAKASKREKTPKMGKLRA